MLRITKAFENDSISIYKIEGKISEETLGVWAEEIRALNKMADRQIILDLSQVWFICTKGMEVLVQLMSNNLYLLNCPMEVRNVLHTAGLSARILE
jgi:anti-anti-sigma regulatory factor